MKLSKIISLILTLAVINCYSQTEIQIERNIEAYPNAVTGVYYKDLNNVLDPFVGTFVYNDLTTNTRFEILLQKKLNSFMGGRFTQDMLIGSYKYIENGILKVDALNDLNNNFNDGRSHKISGYNILNGTELGCTDCSPNEKRIYGTIKDPVSGSVDRLFIRKIMHNGQEAIKIFILHSNRYVSDENITTPIPISYPLSEYIILTKVN